MARRKHCKHPDYPDWELEDDTISATEEGFLKGWEEAL